MLVSPPERIELTDVSGRDVSGTLVELTSSTLTMLVDARPRPFQEADVGTVRRRYRDSLRNGALWGLGVGAGIGAAGALASDFWGSDARLALIQVAANAGLGAAAGVAVDVLIKGRQVIYEGSPQRPAKSGVNVPVRADRIGVFFSIRP
jgi:hypothetical protein